MMHEAGHFYGVNHSENKNAIMFPKYNDKTNLHEDDINGIQTLYNGVELPSIDEDNEDVDYHFMGCASSVSGPIKHSKSIFSLLF